MCNETIHLDDMIDNFRNVECFSNIFKAIDLDGNEQEWRVKIIPSDIGVVPNEYIPLYVELNPSNWKHYPAHTDPELNANLQVAIKNSKGKEVFGKDMFIKTRIHSRMSYGFTSFLKKDIIFDPKNGLLPAGKLTIVCKIQNIKVKDSIINKGLPEIIVPENQLMAGIGTLFEKMNFSDCTVTIVSADNKEIKASKCVLACHSPVLAAMFEHETTIESQNNTIIIPDFDSNVLKQMLQYMYNENSVNYTGIDDELLAAAEKYGLERFKALCERELAHSMAVKNACELLILSTLNSAEQLKFYAVEYIKQHEKQVKASDGWKLLDEEHLRLLGFQID